LIRAARCLCDDDELLAVEVSIMRKFGAAILAALLLTALPAAAQRGGFHGGFAGHSHFNHPRFFFGGGFFPVLPFGASYYGYPYYAYAASYGWYCANPPGYYPYVPQCAVPWQQTPAPP
jgi:hypothetical protein